MTDNAVTGVDFDYLYHRALFELYSVPDNVVSGTVDTDVQRQSGFVEILGYQFKLFDVSKNVVHSKARKFNHEYAKAFFHYVMTGELTTLLDNDSAKRYLVEFGGRNTQYGPRINAQLPEVLEELRRDVNSRRAVITILRASDQEFLNAKHEGETTIEYPCTNTLTFAIRDNKLHLVSNMRSQSAALVMPYDIYNWTSLMEVVKNNLTDTYPGLELGTLTHQVASLHYYISEQDLVEKILIEKGYLR